MSRMRFQLLFLLTAAAVNCQLNISSCGLEKACFLPKEANCYMGCNGMAFSYVFTDNSYQFMNIEITGKSASSTGFYFAVGFSTDIMMGADSVIECSSLGNDSLSLKFSYNVQNFNKTGEPSNVRITNQDSSYFTNQTISYADGVVYCSAKVKVSGAVDPQVFKFDKNSPNYYLLMANGPTNSEGLLHHVHDVTTPLSVNLMDVYPAFDPNGCGVTKGCFIPTADECNGTEMAPYDMIVSYFMINDSYLQLEILGNATSKNGHYVAVGFSLTNTMGNQSVIECSQYGNESLSTKFSYNTPNSTNIRIDNETDIRQNFIKDHTVYQDGKLFCTATILVDGSSGNAQIFKYDKNQPYYLLMAKGETKTNPDGLTQPTTSCIPKIPVKLSQLERNFDVTTCNSAVKTCFLPIDCYLGCNGMGFSFKMTDPSTMQIEIFSVGTALGYYVAVGFSPDNQMGNESVIECSSIGNENYSIKFSYNLGGSYRYNTRIVGEPEMRSQFILKENVSFVDGSLYCSATVNVSGWADNPQVFTYDPNKNYYLLMASGTTNQTALAKHFDHVVSDQPYDLMAGKAVSPTPSSFNCSACKKSKGCYFPDDSFTCNGYGVSYRYISDSVLEMELVKKGTDGYIAVGFSDDNKMGDDYVIECSNLAGAGGFSWKFSYNNKNLTNVRIENEAQIERTYFTDVNVKVENGEIYCYAKVNVAGWSGSAEVFKYTPNKKYFLLLAQGLTTSDGLKPHSDKSPSPMAYDVKQFGAPIDTEFKCAQCGVTKSCFFPEDQSGCTGTGVAIQYMGPMTMVIELFKKGTGGYVAVGFNPNAAQMASSNVIECSQMASQNMPSWKFSYNDPKNVRIPNETQIEGTYFSNNVVTQQNGATYCRATVNVGGWNGSSEVFTFDPAKLYYLIMAIGPTQGEVLDYHSTNKWATSSKLNLTEAGAPIDIEFKCAQCGVTKSCFFPEDQGGCTGAGVAIQYMDPVTMIIELFKNETGGYVAVGFNPNAAQMASSNVIECSQMASQNMPSWKFSYNDPKNVRISNETQIERTYFSNNVVTQQNGTTYCRATVNVGGWNGSSEVFTFNPTKLYYLIMAIGPTQGEVLDYHSTNKWATSSKLNLTEPGQAKSKGMSPTVIARLIRAHAVMMILAWVCFVPTAILFARFLRTSWPLIKPGGLLIWFHVHRTCNYLGITLMIASFVCVMTANSWKWTGPPNGGDKWAQVHTMCGLFALIFAWAQPFISFMRCQPNTPNRPFFNWTHRLVGVVAYILATTALSIAAYHFTPLAGQHWTNGHLQLGLVLCPIALITVLVIIFPVLDHYQDKEHNHGTIEMIRQIVVLVSVGLMAGDAIALAIMICV